MGVLKCLRKISIYTTDLKSFLWQILVLYFGFLFLYYASKMDETWTKTHRPLEDSKRSTNAIDRIFSWKNDKLLAFDLCFQPILSVILSINFI